MKKKSKNKEIREIIIQTIVFLIVLILFLSSFCIKTKEIEVKCYDYLNNEIKDLKCIDTIAETDIGKTLISLRPLLIIPIILLMLILIVNIRSMMKW